MLGLLANAPIRGVGGPSKGGKDPKWIIFENFKIFEALEGKIFKAEKGVGNGEVSDPGKGSVSRAPAPLL